MNKKLIALVCGALISSNFLTTNVDAQSIKKDSSQRISINKNINQENNENNPYVDEYTVDLNNLDLKIENGKIVAHHINSNYYLSSIVNENQSKDLLNLSEVLKDKEYEKDLKNLILQNKKPIQISVSKVKVIEKLDENGEEISSRLMTVDEVNNIKNNGFIEAASQGTTQRYNGLSLYTTVSGSGPDYWVQANAYWEHPGTSRGKDYISITWPSNFTKMNNDVCKVSYTPRFEDRGGLYTVKPNAGAIWQFRDVFGGGSEFYQAKGVYAGCSVKRTSGSKSYCSFTSKYVHATSKPSVSFSFTVGVKANAGTINVSREKIDWPLSSNVSGNF